MERDLAPTPAHQLAVALLRQLRQHPGVTAGDEGGDVEDVDPWLSMFGVDVDGRRLRVDVRDVD